MGKIILFILIFSVIFCEHVYAQSEDWKKTRFWEYQCIDTMKTSRDKARAWKNNAQLQLHIHKEIHVAKTIGANCIALGTPYNSEFLPYLKLWVQEARKENMHIWYRGNFSEWEGWFEYPKNMTESRLHTNTRSFIEENPELFQDGDIFTAAPEAENGGPFDQVEINEYQQFRRFLIKEHSTAEHAFNTINKDVEINWMSMNGGLAKRMLDADTVLQLGNVVTIDHYIKNSEEMGEFIQYFYDTYKAQTVVGEFGAPIPEINGNMSEAQQAQFVGELLHELYIYKDKVKGINYWTLYDGSTALVDFDFRQKLVAHVIKSYYRPRVVASVVTADDGTMLEGVHIRTPDKTSATYSDSKGSFSLPIPPTVNELIIEKENYDTKTIKITDEIYNEPITLVPSGRSIWYHVRKVFETIINF